MTSTFKYFIIRTMKTLIMLLIVSLASPQILADNRSSSVPIYIYNAANQFGLDVGLLYAICTVESKCRPKAVNKDDATKAKKALGIREHSIGLFQIKLATARGLGFFGTSKELLKPEVNTFYAAKLIRSLYDRYGDTVKVISAYNNGKYTLKNKDYVNKVLTNYIKYKIDKKI